MATFEQFQQEFDKQNAAIENIVADIQVIKDQVANSGLTGEQEDALLTQLTGLTTKVEALAAENPEAPVEP